MRREMRRKKAVSGIIAAMFLFAMLFTTGVAYFAFVQYTQQLQQVAARERLNAEIEQNLERFLVTGTVPDGNIWVGVNNTGPVPIRVVSVFVMDTDGTLYEAMDADLTVNSGTNVLSAIDTGVSYSLGTQYTIKVITERGNSGLGHYPPLTLRYATVEDITAQIATGIGPIAINFSSIKVIYPEAHGLPGLADVSQTGYDLVNGRGYPAFATLQSKEAVFVIEFTNYDPLGRDLYLNKLTQLQFLIFSPGVGGGVRVDARQWFIVEDFDEGTGRLVLLSSPKLLPYGSKTTIMFGLKPDTQGVPSTDDDDIQVTEDMNKLFYQSVFFILHGYYSDNLPFAQTIPFSSVIAVEKDYASASFDPVLPFQGAFWLSNYTGGSNRTITAYWANPFIASASDPIKIGWVNANGTITTLTTATSGTSISITIPFAPAGKYAVQITDGIRTAFLTYEHT